MLEVKHAGVTIRPHTIIIIIIIIIIITMPSGVKIPRVNSKVKSKMKS